MITIKKQEGVGLIEVLVALLILAVGVLGFVALQYRAIEASSEGANRVQAINLARDLAEKIRVNRDQLGVYATAIAGNATNITNPNCYTAFCTPTQMARFDAALTNLSAQRVGMTVNMFACPEVSNGRRCIYVAWGDTAATNADGLNNCTTAGAYRDESTCVVMEAY